MNNQIRPLLDVLLEAEQLPWRYALYLKGSYPWKEDTPCAVLDPDDVDDPEEDPEFAKVNNMIYGLLVSTAQDIVSNLKAQKPNFNHQDLIDAFNFYYSNDAFILF